jgi:murein DD-endopeptidase MepM/ murein hydrolase activator NlpD
LAKALTSRRLRLGTSALLAATLCAFLGVPQSSARANILTVRTVNVPAANARALSSRSLKVISPLGLELSAAAKMTRFVKSELLAAKLAVKSTKLAVSTFQRAHLVRISRDYSRPTSNYRLTAFFGERSWLWGSTGHTGQDFAAPYGTQVKAAEAGTVVFAGWDGEFGWKIALSHGNRYGHLSRINVKVGQHVKVAQFIGRVGASGHVTGAHLHFEVQRYGVPIDPVKWLRAVGIWV